MNRFHFFLVSFFILPLSLCAQTHTYKDSLNWMTRPWKIVAMGNGENKIAIPPEKQELMDFKSDGTILLPGLGPDRKPTSWTYLKHTQAILLDRSYKIIKLDSRSFNLMDEETGNKMFMIPK